MCQPQVAKVYLTILLITFITLFTTFNLSFFKMRKKKVNAIFEIKLDCFISSLKKKLACFTYYGPNYYPYQKGNYCVPAFFK